MTLAKVALAGATGNLGRPVLKALLEAGHPVTVLTRSKESASSLEPHANMTVQQVDFDSSADLTPALEGVEVVVSCLATLAIGSQNPLIDAAEAAGVKRFIPAEYGMDSMNPLCQKLPVCIPKVSTQMYLNKKYETNSAFTWTAIVNGLFLDWGVEAGIIIDPKNRHVTLYDGGDVVFSVTNLADIAKAVVGIIEYQTQTTNRVVYIQTAATTQRKLMEFAKEKSGKEWNAKYKDTEELNKESMERFNRGSQGDIMAAMLGFSLRGCIGPGYDGNLSNCLDNDLFGIKTLDDAGLRDLIQRYVD